MYACVYSIVTSCFIWLFEASNVWREHGIEPELRRSQGYKGLVKAWYLGAMRGAGAGGFTPATSFGRASTLSWAFAVLILVSSCT